MALQGVIPVSFGDVFPHGAFAVGAVEPVRDFERSRGGAFVQERDKASGEPLWVLDVLDADPEARAKTVRVKIASAVQPVLPEAPAGMPVVPVEFEGLTVTPYVNANGRLAYSFKARGVKAPGKVNGAPARPAAKDAA